MIDPLLGNDSVRIVASDTENISITSFSAQTTRPFSAKVKLKHEHSCPKAFHVSCYLLLMCNQFYSMTNGSMIRGLATASQNLHSSYVYSPSNSGPSRIRLYSPATRHHLLISILFALLVVAPGDAAGLFLDGRQKPTDPRVLDRAQRSTPDYERVLNSTTFFAYGKHNVNGKDQILYLGLTGDGTIELTTTPKCKCVCSISRHICFK